MTNEMGFWVFVLNNGMPYSVEKCTFQPTIRPIHNGEWVHCSVDSSLQAQLTEALERVTVLEDALKDLVYAIDFQRPRDDGSRNFCALVISKYHKAQAALAKKDGEVWRGMK